MTKSIGKRLFLLAVTILAVLVSLGLWQVAQPWRGVLVLWLFGAGSLGLLVTLVLRQQQAYRAMRKAQGIRYAPRQPRERRPAPTRVGSLRVVTASAQAGARRVVR